MYDVRNDVVLPLKHCPKCDLFKPRDCFYKSDRNKKDGLGSYCKECDEKVGKIWYEQNKQRRKETNKIWYEQNKQRRKEADKIWREQNKQRIRAAEKIWREQNKQRIRAAAKIRHRKRYIGDVSYKLRTTVSKSIHDALKQNNGGKRGLSCMEFLPYTIQELKEHLEKQFDCYMCWENHGSIDSNRYTWQIDHIIPHSSFHYESMDCEEFRQCWALSNLRPLKAIDNIKKGNRQ